MTKLEKTYLIQNIGVFLLILGYFGLPVSTFTPGAILGFGALLYRWKVLGVKPDCLQLSFKKPLAFMAFFALCLFLSSSQGTNTSLSLEAAQSQVHWWRPCFFLMVLFNDRREFYQAVCGALALGMLSLLYAALDSLRSFLCHDKTLVDGGFLNHNLFGAFLNLLLPWVVLGVCHYTSNRYLKGLGFGLVALGVAGVALSASRGAVVALGVTALLLALFNIKNRRYLALAVLALILLLGVSCSNKDIASRFIYSQKQIESMEQMKEEVSSKESGRLFVWEGAWAMFQDHKLWGVGLYNFNANYRNHYMVKGANEPNLEHAHNTILQRLAETGLVGSLGFWVLMLYQLGYLFKRSKDRSDKGIFLAGLAVMLIALLHGMVDYFFGLALYARIFWMQWAVCYCAGEAGKNGLIR